MNWLATIGYVASVLTFVTFCMKAILPLRYIGVIGVFAPEKERPWTAVCKMDGELLTVSNEKVIQVFYENPRFGISLARLITKRAIADMSQRR